MVKAISFVFLAIAYAALVSQFEQNIMYVLGSSKVAGYAYVFGIFLLPMLMFLAFSMKAYQSWVAQKKNNDAR